MADTISIHCADETMGECTPDECEQYRAWLKEQIETRYPDAIVEISSRHSLNGPFYHIDNDDRDDLTPCSEDLFDYVSSCSFAREEELNKELNRLVQDLRWTWKSTIYSIL